MKISKGDTVKITGVEGYYWCEGEVLTAADYGHNGQENWYIELTATAGNIQGRFPCYTYWKQQPDGGQVETFVTHVYDNETDAYWPIYRRADGFLYGFPNSEIDGTVQNIRSRDNE